jgi:hypothetical protein
MLMKLCGKKCHKGIVYPARNFFPINFSVVSDDQLGTNSSRNADDGREITGQVGLQHVGSLLLGTDKGCPRGVMLSYFNASFINCSKLDFRLIQNWWEMNKFWMTASNSVLKRA